MTNLHTLLELLYERGRTDQKESLDREDKAVSDTIKALDTEVQKVIGEDDKPNIGCHNDDDIEWCDVCDSVTYEGEDSSSWCLCHQKNKWRAEQRKAWNKIMEEN